MTTPDDLEQPGPSVSYEVLAALLCLSELRSRFRVALALVERFPDEQDWEAATRDPDFLESLTALADIVSDIRMDGIEYESATPNSVADAVTNHYGRAIESVEPIAETLGVAPSDLLSVLINA